MSGSVPCAGQGVRMVNTGFCCGSVRSDVPEVPEVPGAGSTALTLVYSSALT